jgi:type III secretion protein J
MRIWVILVAFVALTGCTAELYHGLSEAEANDMIVALDEAGISANKAADPAGEGWMVQVASGEKSDAWRVLRQRGLPRPEPKGFGSFYPSDGLVPTAGEERVLLQYATAQELRAGLLTIDGVVDAHVNLVLPEKPRVRLSDQPVEPPRASVVVTYGGEASPLSEDRVKSLVVGGVEGMTPEHVTVMLSRIETAAPGAPRYDQVGPISVAPANATMMQFVFGGMLLLIMVMAAAVVFLVVRR